jgi:hypothetical protein
MDWTEGSCEHGNEPSGLKKMLGPNTMQLVS